MRSKILIVLANITKYPGMDRAAGLWLEELVPFFELSQGSGYKIDCVSPKGGFVPVDPLSLKNAGQTEWKWYQKEKFLNCLGRTLKPEEVNPEDYRVIYFAGGHGSLWDYPENEILQKVCREIYKNTGVISSICHGVCGLLNVKLDDTYLLEGKEVTGFSPEEEKLAGLDRQVPFSIETELLSRGAIYKKTEQPFNPFVVVSDRLVTGQNIQSAYLLAEKVVDLLNESNKKDIEDSYNRVY